MKLPKPFNCDDWDVLVGTDMDDRRMWVWRKDVNDRVWLTHNFQSNEGWVLEHCLEGIGIHHRNPTMLHAIFTAYVLTGKWVQHDKT